MARSELKNIYFFEIAICLCELYNESSLSLVSFVFCLIYDIQLYYTYFYLSPQKFEKMLKMRLIIFELKVTA